MIKEMEFEKCATRPLLETPGSHDFRAHNSNVELIIKALARIKRDADLMAVKMCILFSLYPPRLRIVARGPCITFYWGLGL